jgi:7-cyano-7-deazaguanine synthase
MDEPRRPGTALVLFSGGQDSTTCLAWALERFEAVETVGFDYGQRHRVELECRQKVLAGLRERFPWWGERLHDDHVLNLGVLKELGATAMTHDVQIKMEQSGLPNTFVPGRNVLFFTLAAAIAYRRNIRVLVGGMCETDFSGYPDCRHDTISALQATLGLAMDHRFTLETPLMWIDKCQTWALAKALGGEALLSLIIEDTHTCYLGERSTRHDWGYGCGQCPACDLRKTGYASYVCAGEPFTSRC